MKLQLDTIQKTIKIEENINLKELVDTLEELLPFGKWKEFTLELNAQLTWAYPVYPWSIEPVPCRPWITWESGTVGSPDILYTLTTGVFNVEV